MSIKTEKYMYYKSSLVNISSKLDTVQNDKKQIITFYIPGKFYVDEELKVSFIVSNIGGGNTVVNVTIDDDKYFAIKPTSKLFNMAAGENITSSFTLKAGSVVGETT